MSNEEAALLAKYKITTLDPAEWPAEADLSSDDETLANTPSKPARKSTRSRFSVLEKSRGSRKSLPGAERSRHGIENLVQKDEQDPLGSYPSVVQVLSARGLPAEDDIKLRNRFLLSSTNFSPTLFLSQVHSDASTDDLLHGLDYLSRSIEKKSASLKILVETNFDRFVRAKSTIDNVYREMRDQGQESEASHRFPHSRHGSRNSFSNRKLSAPPSPGFVGAVPAGKKKNALIKESEYGVQGIKGPLTEVAAKAEEVWGPALGGQEKQETLKAVLTCLEKNHGLFEVGSAIHDAIRRRDHESIIEEYARARKYASDARAVMQNVEMNNISLSDPDLHQIIVTARMWADVESQIDAFRRDAWKRLLTTHFGKQNDIDDGKSEQHMELISIMLEIGVEDNPIWLWLQGRYDFLKSRVLTTCERSKVEIEILRRHLSNGGKPTAQMVSTYFRSVGKMENGMADSVPLDSPKVNEFWNHVLGSMNTLISLQGGILGDITEYWDIARSFIDGKAQKSLPLGMNGQSAHHHQLSREEVQRLERGAVELAHLIREHLWGFFSDPPIEDISLLFSPVPPTPATPRTPMSSALSPLSETRFRFDANNVPPPSPARGEPWEKYAFWPPHANALSGCSYLSKVLALIGSAANELASLRLNESGVAAALADQLKALVGGVRERCAQAVCAAWTADAENARALEDWSRNPERRDVTNMPARFLALQSFLLAHLQKILFLSGTEAARTVRPGVVDVVAPPSSRLLQMVRSQFVGSLYKTLSGMVESAEKTQRSPTVELDAPLDDLTVVGKKREEELGFGRLDVEKVSTRLLLTMATLSHLNTDTIPHLITLFESSFSIKLTDETAQIRHVLSQIDRRLFHSYTKPLLAKLTRTIQAGVQDPGWAPETPRRSSGGSSNVRVAADRVPSPFIFAALLDLVIVHTEVTSIAPQLTPRIQRTLFEHGTTVLQDTLSQLSRCSLAALVQATLDVEFLSQTLTAYTTEKAGLAQTNIYQILDKKTDNGARVRLQDELPALRAVLKRLRESTRAEFACFRRVKRSTVVGGGTPGADGGGALGGTGNRKT